MSNAEESQKPDTPKKTRSRKDKNDPVRFHGNGVNFRAKLIGIEEVSEPRGDKMCQDAMQTLKSVVKAAGEHKQRVTMNVSLDGLKILEDKSGAICHHHAVHRISFIARDVTDARAFGYIYSPGDGKHKFYGIKTEKAAESLVLTLRDLFQVVFEMKKREVEDAKKQKEVFDNRENSMKEDNLDRTSIDSRDSNRSETPKHGRAKSRYSSTGGASKSEKSMGNLLNLESELENLEQQMSAFGPQWDVTAPPASPGGWSAGSDSLGTPVTPHSMGQPSVVSTQATAQAQQPAISVGGGFSTIPRLNHQSTAVTIPTIAGPTTMQRPKSVQKQGSFSKSAQPKLTSWATFDSPSPPGPPPDTQFETHFDRQPSPQIKSKLEAKFLAQAKARPQAQAKLQSQPQPESVPGIKSQTVPALITTQTFSSIPVEDDPFKNDPFFNSAPATVPTVAVDHVEATTESAPVMDRYAVFSDMSQVSFVSDTATNQTANESNPFTDKAFSPSESVDSPPPSNDSALQVFSSTPIQPTDKQSEPIDLFKTNHKAHTDKKDVSRNAIANPPTTKPNILELGEQKQKVLLAPSDPFGAVSPNTEAKLNTTVASDDPFDTSSFLLPKSHGPLDLSQLKPVSLDKSVPGSNADASYKSSLVVDNYRESPEMTLPFPSDSPPPLPFIDPPPLPNTVPAPPPRPQPGTAAPSHVAPLLQQSTVDKAGIAPPPIPKRPPLVSSQSPKLLRQTTIQFPVEAAAPPPPPPRPGLNGIDHPKLAVIGRTGSLGGVRNVPSDTPPPLPPLRPVTDGPFNTSIQQDRQRSTSTRTSISPIPRPRPRPRATTPANISSNFTVPERNVSFDTIRPSSASEFRDTFNDRQSSFGKGQADKFDVTFPVMVFENNVENKPATVSARTDSPSIVKESLVDPFADVDPFAEEEQTDPFSDMPDPFTLESPMDPFSNDFTGELFTTKAVTLNFGEAQVDTNDPFKDDPFAKDPFHSSVPRGNELSSNVSTIKDNFDETTFKTDTSLEASVSLPFAYTTDSSSLVTSNENSLTQNGDLSTSGKKSDPFEFDVFSNDFFKNQLNSITVNDDSSSGKVNSSWAFLGDSTDSAAPKAQDNTTCGLPNSMERVSPGLTPSSIPGSSTRDADSSSNSEIADAFGEDSIPHQVNNQVLAPANYYQAQPGNVFGNPFI